MNTKDNQRSRITKLMMKQAYISLMHEMPSSKITVKDICTLAEINRSTFYLHYNEPNDVLIELEDEAINQVAESFNVLSKFDKDLSNIEKDLTAFLRYIQKNDELFRTFLVENHDSHFRQKLLNYAVKAGEEGFRVSLEPAYKRFAYLYLVSGCIELLSDWIQHDYETSEKQMCELFYLLCEGTLHTICEKHYQKQ